ncbi:DNA polymerase Y family protein [Gimesia panareensis]|uniref:DNA polymerase Y family protein n=1 Tax=Gimesia panareensis TaxID=2527978 RepID=UPI00118C326B|nr:DNA polymerase IV [Gimesia panareensis]QDU49144.1 DNA polymerase IV [Gimesia panareensis]
MGTSLIGHIDSDCFYVSCERVRSYTLRGVPCGVLGNQGACVIAKSYELKSYGVKTGHPIWEAKKLCPHAVFVKRDFRWYEVISRRLLDLLKTVSPRVEYYSIDEMFFDASELQRYFQLPLEEATRALQTLVQDEVGVPVSIGIAPSRALAKLGSDASKPFGVHIVDRENCEEFLRSQPVGELCGIGRRSERKLQDRNIHTCWDFRQADRLLIRDLLTIKGEALWWELRGDAVTPIQTSRPPHKAIARGGSCGGKTSDPERIRAWAVRNIERLIEALDHHRVYARHISLQIDANKTALWLGRTPLAVPSASFRTIYDAVMPMLAAAPKDHLVSHMHIIAENLVWRDRIQKSLFFEDAQSPLDELKRNINQKLGRFAIRSAETLPLHEIYHDTTHNYDICDISGKMCF